MAKFVKQINLDPRELRNMDMENKQECMAEIDRRRKFAWLYSCIFSGGMLVFFLVYALISMFFTLSYKRLLPSVDVLFMYVPAVIMLLSFFAHMMNGKFVVAASIAYLIAGFIAIITSEFINAWIFPFAFFGVFVYFRLSQTCDMYHALEKEEGFPEFCDIKGMSESAKAVIERGNEKEESLHILTEMAILSAGIKAKNEQADNSADDKSVPEEKFSKNKTVTENKSVSDEKPSEDKSASENKSVSEEKPPAENKKVSSGKKRGGKEKKKISSSNKNNS